MHCYLLMITVCWIVLIYICFLVSFRDFSNLDFRSSVRSIGPTCDNFIIHQKIVSFVIWIFLFCFVFFKGVLNCLLAGKSPCSDFPVFPSCSHHFCFYKSSLWTVVLLSSDIQSLPKGVLGLSISKRQQLNAAIWSTCKWDNIDQHDKHAVTLKLYINIFNSLQTTSSHSHFKLQSIYTSWSQLQ